MSSRAHDRNHFFKYSSFKTAIRVIESKSFRWSAPTKFNDPFDHQTGFVLKHAPSEYGSALANEIQRIVFAEEEPTIIKSSLFTFLTLKLREVRHKLTQAEVMRDITESGLVSAERLQLSLDQLNTEVTERLCHSRVFCVSERYDNVVMWSHYADEHRGVVFKLRCIDELDNTLLAAKKVVYTDAFIPFPDPESFAKHLTGESPLNLVDLIWELAFTKHIDWSYEQEWRVHVALRDEEALSDYTIYSEHSDIFESVYLGCNMSEQEVQVITELVKAHLPKTMIFKGRKSPNSFALGFTRIL